MTSCSHRFGVISAVAVLALIVGVAPRAHGGEPPPPPDRSAGTDFDGNGSTDVFWYGPGVAPDEVWQWDGEGFVATSVPVSGSYRQLFLDADGDGRTDIFWYAPGAHPDYLWRSTDAGFVSTAHPVNGTYEPLIVDTTGDGASEIFWYAPGSRPDYMWRWAEDHFASEPRPVQGSYLPIVADVDPNPGDEIFWYAPGTAPDHLWSWTESAHSSRPLPVRGTYEPFTADSDGDGDQEIFWYAPGPGADHRWDLTSGEVVSTRLALDGRHEPYVADFDGDGTDEVVLLGDGEVDLLWDLDPEGSMALAALDDPGPVSDVSIGDFDGDGFDDLLLAAGHTGPVTWWRGGPEAFDVRQLEVAGTARNLTADPRTPYASTHVVGNRTITINAFLPVGSADGVTLLHPSWIVERVGWHQAHAGNLPSEMSPSPTAIGSFTLPSRGRGTPRHTAADIASDPSSPIWAAETGTVARAGTYYLRESNGRLHFDVFVVIRPDSNPAKEVTMLHMVGLNVQPGDRVESGVTVVADHPRTFPFASQLDAYTANPSWPHVHLEIRTYKGSSPAGASGAAPAGSVPNTPSGTSDPTLCEDDDAGTFEPCGDD